MMEESIHPWEDDEIVGLLQTIQEEISEEFWRDGEALILPSQEAPGEFKADFAAILEVTNYIYEGKFPLAVERFKKLTERQKKMLVIHVQLATGELEHECPHCVEERQRKKEEAERREKITDHHRRMQELSREKTYEVSEDIYQNLLRSKDDFTALLSRIQATLDLLDEDDPRYQFAEQLLESVYG